MNQETPCKWGGWETEGPPGALWVLDVAQGRASHGSLEPSCCALEGHFQPSQPPLLTPGSSAGVSVPREGAGVAPLLADRAPQ